MNVVVEEDCLTTDFLDCSHRLNEMVGLCRIQNSKVCFFRGSVEVSNKKESEVLYRKQK